MSFASFASSWRAGSIITTVRAGSISVSSLRSAFMKSTRYSYGTRTARFDISHASMILRTFGMLDRSPTTHVDPRDTSNLLFSPLVHATT